MILNNELNCGFWHDLSFQERIEYRYLVRTMPGFFLQQAQQKKYNKTA